MATYFSSEHERDPFKKVGKFEQVLAVGKQQGGTYPTAAMTIYQTNAKEKPNFDFSGNGHRNSNASELFEHRPADVEINTAFSHTKMRHTVPIMASYLHQKYGDLTVSEDLSVHSSRLATHAKKLNLPIKSYDEDEDDSEAYFDVTNDYDFEDSEMEIPYVPRGFKEIKPETIAGAKQHYKELRGITKPKAQPARQHMGPQFTQPQFPGMEG